MKSIAILNQDCDLGAKGKIQNDYDGEPNPSNFGRASVLTHIQVPVEMENDVDCIDITWEDETPVLTLNSAKKTAKTQAASIAYVDNIIEKAMMEGAKLVKEFTRENIMMGITADNMTGTVLDVTKDVILAAQTGSLKDAVKRIKAIPQSSYDAKYITEVRLLAFANKARQTESLGLEAVETIEDVDADF